MRLSRSAPRWVLLMNLSAWRPTFARVGAPGEARLAGVTGLTWGSSTGAQVPHLLTAADVGHRPKKSQALSAAGGPGNGRAFAGGGGAKDLLFARAENKADPSENSFSAVSLTAFLFQLRPASVEVVHHLLRGEHLCLRGQQA
jgi:hypothetical protein